MAQLSFEFFLAKPRVTIVSEKDGKPTIDAVLTPQQAVAILADPAPVVEEILDHAETMGESDFGSSTGAEDDEPSIRLSANLSILKDDRNYRLVGNRNLATDWIDRAKANIAAITLAQSITKDGRQASPEEQDTLVNYVGWGSSTLANKAFKQYNDEYAYGWEGIGTELEGLLSRGELAKIRQGVQYAHYTPEPIIDAMWTALTRMGFTGGNALDPGTGIGLFLTKIPEAVRHATLATAIELDPVSASIAQLLLPNFTVKCEDFARTVLPQVFDVAIGNPPYSDLIVKGDQTYRKAGFRLHDFFIIKALDSVKPGGLAAFITSRGTLDKETTSARQAMMDRADLVAAYRLPNNTFTATAGATVVTDILLFRRRAAGQPYAGEPMLNLQEKQIAYRQFEINQYFAAHPEHILGTERLNDNGRYGATEYRVIENTAEGEAALPALLRAIETLPSNLYTPAALEPAAPALPAPPALSFSTAEADAAARYREGSYVVSDDGALCQITDGAPLPVRVKSSTDKEGIFRKHADIIIGLIPVRDAVRAVLKAQREGQDGRFEQAKLHRAYDAFLKKWGPINHTTVTVSDSADGEAQETRRTPNLQPFLDDPDAYLTASIEIYDEERDAATKGPVFSEIVVAPPSPPTIDSVFDALNVCLNNVGRVHIPTIAKLAKMKQRDAIAALGESVFENPKTGEWETTDAYLSGAVRTKLAFAESVASVSPRFARNVEALKRVQPVDLKASDITARVGAPWIPVAVIEEFVRDILQSTATSIYHTPEIGAWTVRAGYDLQSNAIGTTDFGTNRRHVGMLLEDALNARTPEIYDEIMDMGTKKRVLNEQATEAAREKLMKLRSAFESWIWLDADRAQTLVRLYNDEFNNLRPRQFNGDHLTLPNASPAITLRAHQKRAVWRICSAGNTMLAHRVGAGKTMEMIASAMEMRRLGIVTKPMITVPNHVLKQFAREFMQLYPTARILVADEQQFQMARRRKFLARVATGIWDAVIIPHSAFGLVKISAEIERGMVQDQIDQFEELLLQTDEEDRISRKRLERMKEGFKQKMELLADRQQDDTIHFDELGVDFVFVDESHEFRKLSFVTNQSSLKGIDPNGSQRAWDLYVKTRWLEDKNPGRSHVLASGTPVTNTMGELYTVLRFLAPGLLEERSVHQFDAWALAFGETATNLELQPNGKYKPVTRFSQFVNVPELISMFRSIADIVMAGDLAQYVKLPAIKGGKRQLVRAPASDAFKAYQKVLDARIKAIEDREGAPQPGDDILLSVIGDGRHAAIDLRLVGYDHNEPDNKLNQLIRNAFEIYQRTGNDSFSKPDGTPYERTGGLQMIFSDLGTEAAAEKRGFSAYEWIRDELIRLGVPASEICFMQNYKKSDKKLRLFDDCNAGKVRFLIGSTKTMGTGVNAQLRLKAIHHLCVPWLPSDVEQREGRGVRQGNAYDEIEIYAYALMGSLDAQMWGTLERKARFIEQALRGDSTIRRLEDLDSLESNQFAIAKALASGDERLMQKAGLEADLARLRRLRAAHIDDQMSMRWGLSRAAQEIEQSKLSIINTEKDLARRVSTAGDDFEMVVNGDHYSARKQAGQALLDLLNRYWSDRRVGDMTIATLGGFDIVYTGERRGKRYDWDVRLLRAKGLQRFQVEENVTDIGIIRRLENVIAGFEDDVEEQRSQIARAERKITDFTPKIGLPFEFTVELEEKEAELQALEAEMAAESEKSEDDTAQGGLALVMLDDDATPDELLALIYSHLHPNGDRFREMLTDEQRGQIFCLGDGSGDFTIEQITEFDGGQTWEHITTSSLPALRTMVAAIYAAILPPADDAAASAQMAA